MDTNNLIKYLDKHALPSKALAVAQYAHKDQKRKWTKQPEAYINHPIRVAATLYNVITGFDKILSHESNDVLYYDYENICNIYPSDLESIVSAALLHDVIEDTEYRLPEKQIELSLTFGEKVYDLVLQLTSPTSSVEWGGTPRDHKFGVEVKHWAKMDFLASMIKLADRIDNLKDVGYAPHKWLKKYLDESKILNLILGPPHPTLSNYLANRIGFLDQ